MPLLNKRLIQDTVAKHKHEIGSSTKQNLQTLFKDTLNRIETGKFKKEESEKVPFLQRLFELLGYKLHENLEFEYSTSFGRSIDGVLGLQTEKGRDVEIAIEWKGIDTKSLDKGKAGETPVSQMWDYMGKVGAEIGIVGNFLEFRIYTLKTKQTDYQEYFLRELVEKEDKLDEFIFLLKKQTLLKNDSKQSLLENLISQSEAQQEQITKRFYNDYKQRRLNLFGHLVENNPEINKHILVEKAQKILDRLIFIMFCEDSTNDLLPKNILTDTYNLGKKNRSRSETKIWEQFQYLFEDIDKGRYDIQPSINAYNGGLFAEDLELNNLVIKDEVWEWFNQISEKYDFESDLNVNILGHIFEQSISDIEEIKSEIEVAEGLSLHDKQNETTINGTASVPLQKPKTSKRKKDGIYYTPEYITDYIVSETIGNWLGDQEIPLLRGGNEVDGVFPLNQIKILDPAGGSGAFPNQVHNFLSKKHEAKFKELSTDENDLFNQVQIDKSILQNNIFMVDLQPESVEIAKLSLWLKTAKKDQKLNNLDSNIKCGNSLINDPEIAGNTAFDWNKEFPEVMASGGFDVIIGNPPYGGEINKTQQEYYINKYTTAYYKLDTYALFIEQGINLLKAGGYLGFIVPYTWLTIQQHKKLRELLLSFQIVQIIDLPVKVFDAADLDTVILILKKEKPKETVEIGEIIDNKIEIVRTIRLDNIKKNPDLTINISNSEEDFEIIQKIQQNSFQLKEQFEVSQGYIPYRRSDLVKEYGLEEGNRIVDERLWHSDEKKDEMWKQEIQGRDIERYSHTESHQFIKYGKHLAGYVEPKFFKSPRILIMEVTRGDENKIKSVFTDKEYYNTPSIINIIQEENNVLKLKFVLGVINSKIISWYHTKTSPKANATTSIPKILVNDVRNLPIPKATTEQQTQIADLVDQIMNLKKEMQDYLKNTFILLQAELGGQKITLNKKLEKFWTLDFAEFLGELTKQKIQISHPQKRNLITSFEADKKKILEMEQRVEIVDTKIEGLVRGLYGVK
jgi:hypothetical protein